jgi:hypothetical protein
MFCDGRRIAQEEPVADKVGERQGWSKYHIGFQGIRDVESVPYYSPVRSLFNSQLGI